jgi:septal ring factor EnvC (AmiA/AmiB activator)
MKGKMTPEEWKAYKAEAEADIQRLRTYVASEREKLAAKRRAEAEKPRGLRRLFSF